MTAASPERRRLGSDDLVLSAGCLGGPPVDVLAEAATAGGFAGVTLWPRLYPVDPAIGETLRSAGLEVVDMDATVVWVGPDDPGGPYYEEASRAEVFEAAAALGASGVNALLAGAGPVSVTQAAETMADLAEQAAGIGVDVFMEFSLNRVIPDPLSSAAVIAEVGRPNCALTVDFWHVHYGPGDFADLAAIPGAHIGAIQMSDVPADKPKDLAWATRHQRCVPGEGMLDLPGAVRILRSTGCTAPITLEVFDAQRLAALGPVGFARQLGEATRQALATLAD